MSGNVPPDPRAPIPPDPIHPEITGLPESDLDADLLRALERVDTDLAALRDAPAPPIPSDVAAHLDAALLAAGQAPKRAQRVGRWIVAAAAAVAVFAGVTGVAALREQPTTPVAESAPDLGAALTPDAGAAPTVLARALRGETVDTGPLADPAALNACLRAAGENGAVVGALRAQFAGNAAVLTVVADPHSGALTAVVVAQTCTPHDPQVLARTALG